MQTGQQWLDKQHLRIKRAKFRARYHIAQDQFWRKFNKTQDVLKKLEILKEFAAVRIHNPVDAKTRREQFEKSRGHIRIHGKPCGCCGGKAEHRHHIIMLKNGGANKKRNIIVLCEWCHCQIHPFMPQPEILPESMKETMERVAREFYRPTPQRRGKRSYERRFMDIVFITSNGNWWFCPCLW